MDNKSKILQAALDLFVSRGFSSSTALISKEAGVSTGLLFHYYPTKNDLIVSLYAECLSQYYLAAVEIMESPVPDLESYKDVVRRAREAIVNWGLENWKQFQYVQLVEANLLANQFAVMENDEIRELKQRFSRLAHVGIENKYLKDLPAQFQVNASLMSNVLTIEFLHDHPEYRHDPDFLEKSWEFHWNMISW